MKKKPTGRRRFLKGAAAGAAALVAKGTTESLHAAAPPPRPAVAPPTEAEARAEMGIAEPAQAGAPAAAAQPASDFMVDVIKTLGVEYVAINPGSAFDGLHESLINYGNNKMPEILTCLHEEQA
ncbi:MAG: thiamine pyrophosphate-binding protein, partial [Acidobacteria bacterium]|nr:thiamine pyrophosphate-binding protein [Acidobacteriota bacterium]